MMPKPCLDCGELTERSRCQQCSSAYERPRNAAKNRPDRYGKAATDWRKVSRRARSIQSFCSDCGSTQNLQADHSPEAYAQQLKRRPVSLSMVDFVCNRCNVNRGPSGPGSDRWNQWEAGKK